MEITEFEMLDPDRVDGVQTPANGIGFLMLKSLEAAEKGRLDAKERDALGESDFAFPKQRKEPINDADHVRDAMARFDQVQGVTDAEKHEAARRILARAKHFGIHVSEDTAVARAAKQVASERGVPRDEAERQTDEHLEGETGPVHTDTGAPGIPTIPGADVRPPASDGQGDTAPDKAVPRSEAESQTRAVNKRDMSDGGGDVAPDDDDEAKREAESQTGEMSAKGAADSEPGSPAWEHKDVQLGERAEDLTAQLAEVVRTFTEREKAEGGGAAKAGRRLSGKTEGAIRRCMQALQDLLDNTPSATKEIEKMTPDELIKALDEIEARRAKAAKQAAKKAAKKAEEKAAKAAAKAAKDAKASKAADDPAAAAKAAEIADLRSRLAALEAQPGPSMTLNAAGVAAVLRDPAASASAFKALEDAVEAAPTPQAKKAALSRLGTAKFIAAENARAARGEMRAPIGSFGVPLITRS